MFNCSSTVSLLVIPQVTCTLIVDFIYVQGTISDIDNYCLLIISRPINSIIKIAVSFQKY